MRLKIELVPKSSWNNNLRSLLKQKQWDSIRKKSYELADGRCDICGKPTKLQCHEVWLFDDLNKIQYLGGLEACCTLCHLCHHMGFALKQHYEGKFEFQSVKRHFMSINNVDEAFFNKEIERAFNEWEERSGHKWSLDIGFLQEYCDINDIEI